MSKHTAACRAYNTVRRFVEEKVAFARKLQEPEDGCVTCGYWRETLEACSKCQKVSDVRECEGKLNEDSTPCVFFISGFLL